MEYHGLKATKARLYNSGQGEEEEETSSEEDSPGGAARHVKTLQSYVERRFELATQW